MKFLHTADWQLGKPFAGIRAEQMSGKCAAMKDQLVDDGRIVPGKGRGGSVALPNGGRA